MHMKGVCRLNSDEDGIVSLTQVSCGTLKILKSKNSRKGLCKFMQISGLDPLMTGLRGSDKVSVRLTMGGDK